MNSIDKYQSMLRVDDRAHVGEVTTPIELVNEMLDRLPRSVFESNSTTFCDPCFGNGTFIVELIRRLRAYGHSMNNIQSRIYGCEISKRLYNKVSKKLSKYRFSNLYLGDALEYNFNNMKFDVVIGNPPYQSAGSSSEGKPIWHFFASLAIDKVDNNGYVCLIHPSGYRTGKPKFKKIFDKLNNYQFEYIKLSNYNTGVKIFGVNTTCDWYVLKKEEPTRLTNVCDVNNVHCKIDMSRVEQIPDADIDTLKKIADLTITDTVDILYNTAYHTQKSHMSSQQTDEHRFPVIYTLKKGGPSLWYSSKNDLGHYNIPKVIMARGMGEPVLDLAGEYATCQFSFAITGSREYLCKVYEALKTPACLEALTSLGTGTGHNYLKEVIRLLRKDFWKEFV